MATPPGDCIIKLNDLIPWDTTRLGPAVKKDEQHQAEHDHLEQIIELTDRPVDRAACVPWVIMGNSGEARVRVCGCCMQDRDPSEARWYKCRCGHTRCDSCRTRECQQCGRKGDIDDEDGVTLDAVDMAGTDPGNPHIAMNSPGMWLPHGEAEHDEVPEQQADAQCRQVTSAVFTCDGCLFSGHGVAWRICRCTARYCIACARRYPCHSCTALLPDFEGEDYYTYNPQQRGTAQCDEPLALPTAIQCPQPISPDVAHAARVEARRCERDRLKQRRDGMRGMVKLQISQGIRPRRDKNRRTGTRFISANPNCAEGVKSELLGGTLFKTAHYLLIQETKLAGEHRDRFVKWARDRNVDVVADEAYVKTKRHGGGTAVLLSGEGLRPACPQLPPECQGRATLAYGDLNGCIVVGSIYGVTGGSTTAQIHLWRWLVQTLTAIGLPFVIGGIGKSRPLSSAA